jgi:branched-chain amino acid transport system substrate-binding protein
MAADSIVIGVLHSERYTYATMMRNSYEMALAAINGQGGINGRPLQLVYADDQGEREPGEKAVRELVKRSAPVMLIGGYQSSNTVYTARVADKLGVPLLITTAADDRITQRKWRNVYRMNPPAGEYAKGVEDLLQQRIKPVSMAIVYENSPYGTGAALRMMWFCREYDIALSKLIPYHKERADPAYFQNLLEPLKDDTPEVIYMVSYLKDAVLLVKTMRELKLDSMLIGGAGGFTHQKFIGMAGDAADGVLTATLWTPQLPYPGAQEYYKTYQQKHSVAPDYHGAEAYAALFVVADVLKRAKSLRPEAIREALNDTNVKTTFGPVVFQSYSKFERQNRLPTMVLKVVNNAFEVIWPEDIATSGLTVPAQ